VDTNTIGDKNLKIAYTYATVTAHTATFQVKVTCPALTPGTITATTATNPPTSLVAHVTIIAAATLFPSVTCAITGVSLITSSSGVAYAPSDSFVTISSTGLIEYDSDIMGN
jgi:hypothetical protein